MNPVVNPSESATPHEAALRVVMKRYWGYDDFRPLQREAMSAVLDGRDSVVVLPTGGGKSLCFQAPAVAMGGTAVVVSPLISLMKDQVDALANCGVPAAQLNSSLSEEERRDVAERLRTGQLKLLYVSPERLVMPRTISFLQSVNVSLVAIDEAHCISSWGHDFRPEYRGLSVLKQALPDIALHAYTATASQPVREDIARQLGLADPAMLVGSFDRPNLTYRVKPAAGRFEQVTEVVLRRKSDSGIVYCISRKEVDKTAAALVALGVRAVPYHAGLSDTERKRNQERFLVGRIDVVVATVAFGMGIDKPDVRYVVHAGLPKSLEAYQQEAGRAGRDGLPAECLLLWSRQDAAVWRRLLSMPNDDSGDGASPEALAAALKALEGVTNYAAGVDCRHKTLVEHFGQDFEQESCGACDVCLGELDSVEGALVVAQKIVSCVARLEQRYGADHTVKVLLGSREARVVTLGHDKLSTYGLLRDQAAPDVRDWTEQLVAQGFLAKVGEYNVLQITDLGMRLLKGNATPRLMSGAKGGSVGKKSARGAAAESWEGVDRDLFERLRTLRARIASESAVAAYIVFGDASLRDLARRRPSTPEGMRQVHGVGEKKLRDYGDAFLAEVRGYCGDSGVATDVEPDEPRAAAATTTPRRDGAGPSAIAAFPHFRQGLSIADVARRLGRASSTVTGYLNDYLRVEGVTDPTPWVEPALVRRIEGAIERVGGARLKPIFDAVAEEGAPASYDDIRVVATCVANRERG
ncbi:MAG: DNA helicase RecQ [Lacipirellulaceae bacterium]